MKSQTILFRAAIATLLMVSLAGLAEARNPHCAGGIQYVVGGLRDKDKGNTEDYMRQMNKAVQQLEQCTTEDSKDYEANAYLGWAYAELDSAGPSGRAFDAGIKGLQATGDQKKVSQWTDNRNSYWVRWYNEGVGKMKSAQEAYADFCKKPADDADKTLQAEAAKNYAQAEQSLMKASLMRPGEPNTLRNLGSLYTFRCEYQKAEVVFNEGLRLNPGDSLLTVGLKAARVNYANQLVDEQKYDEAEKFYTELAKTEPNNSDNFLSLADLHFKRGQAAEGDAKKAQFKLAGDNYGKAAALKPTDGDLTFNAALAYQNAGDFESAVRYWESTVKIRPDDVDALSSYGAALVELKRCDEAVAIVYHAVNVKPQNKNLHRQLGAIYTKCGNNAKATESLMLYLAMSKGEAVADPAALAKAAPAGSVAAKTASTDGMPDAAYSWTADNQKYDTWFYWTKKVGYTFGSGALVSKSDWSGPPPKANDPPTPAGKK